jgi:hypothetical protein
MALSTFSDLKTELTNQGFDYLTSTQQGDYINTAYQEVCALLPWPFLETSTTTLTSGTNVTNLRSVIAVNDPATDSNLSPSDKATLLAYYGALDDTGDPDYFYLDGQTTVKTYPVNATKQLTVHYVKVPADMGGGTDQPVVPLAWRSVIVDGAVCTAHLENGNYEAEQARRSVWQQRVDRMASALLGRNVGAYPTTVVQHDYRNF